MLASGFLFSTHLVSSNVVQSSERIFHYHAEVLAFEKDFFFSLFFYGSFYTISQDIA